ncbi:MAG: hypothetical protein IT372_07600 [Polyangiaceae bacterium]|nr:hypothetical protein [Polyangiaceae bacterium]
MVVLIRWIHYVLALCALLAAGCARAPARSARYAAILDRPTAPSTQDIRAKLAPPEGQCLASAEAYLGERGALMSAPLPPDLQDGMHGILDTLHPVARSVLGRVRGVWLASRIDRAAAVFLTCDVDRAAAAGGFIVIDAGRFPFDRPLRDAEVPLLYWRAIAGDPPPALPADDPLLRAPGSIVIPPRDHAARYLVLHEVGHALSLYASEFVLDRQLRMQLRDLKGFAGFSWEIVTTDHDYLPAPGAPGDITAVLPRADLDPNAWGSLLDAVGADPDVLIPGYALSRTLHPRTPAARDRVVCNATRRLAGAGFVTPTAARYPTEDFAEMFAHAILADEGKLGPSDRIAFDLPGCGTLDLPSPYFSPGVAAKRAYIERALGLAR